MAELCDDVQVVDAETKDANKRWEVLTANLTVRQQHLDSVARLMEQLTHQLQPIEEKQDEAEMLVDAPLTNLTDAEKLEQELRTIEVINKMHLTYYECINAPPWLRFSPLLLTVQET